MAEVVDIQFGVCSKCGKAATQSLREPDGERMFFCDEHGREFAAKILDRKKPKLRAVR